MQALNKEYSDELERIAKELQASEELALYLEEEEEAQYTRLKEMFEPQIGLLYDKLSEFHPLQIIPFEERLLQDDFEGLYLPKILGYSVLRGEINENYKYKRPQEHFKAVLMAICNSANFDILKKRIGQSIQMGFSLSSDIWITNLITPIENRRIMYFLQGQKLEKYRDIRVRKVLHDRYKRQFRDHNFMTADFPTNMSELKVLWSEVKIFMKYRINLKADNSSVIPFIKELISNKEFQGTQEHLQILGLYANFFDLNEENQAHLSSVLNTTRKDWNGFEESWLRLNLEFHNDPELKLDNKADDRVSNLLDKSVNDELSEYYNLLDIIHSKGYVHEEAQEAVKEFYTQHRGLSLLNECARKTIYSYIARLMKNLEQREYREFFQLTRTFTVYMKIFQNQQFNQDVKDLFMAYVRKLLKFYTDKRGKDYQDIKKFVGVTFQDLKFLKEKEVVELFKTRRKRKKPVA
ncbi:MAG: hypothetical protein NXI23_17235 [Bacteroidetes bacterium]|jgi:hypothetical protein|nr:hypothetical protein [Bacteroidota bacterium]MDF1866329.1 hypothetical protein [Saprospiraceae bacterium]